MVNLRILSLIYCNKINEDSREENTMERTFNCILALAFLLLKNDKLINK